MSNPNWLQISFDLLFNSHANPEFKNRKSPVYEVERKGAQKKSRVDTGSRMRSIVRLTIASLFPSRKTQLFRELCR
jgi:hypothetical protein